MIKLKIQENKNMAKDKAQDGKRKSQEKHEINYDKTHPNNKKTQTKPFKKRVGKAVSKAKKRIFKK